MKNMELCELTALELGAALRTGEVSPADVMEAARGRIRACQPENNAFITVTAYSGLMGEPADGPLAGVPMALKDNICTRGVMTSCASKMLGGFQPPYDATVAEKLTRAGAVCLGKLNMDEFAMGSTSETSLYGTVKNPWDLTRAPGGSSGGAAAAVAAGEVWYAIGSDTGGSIRQPASYCGVTGMKPTYGTVSRYGLIAYASSLDQMGPIARSAADCAAVLDLIQGKDPRDGTSLEGSYGTLLRSLTGDVEGLRIGLPTQCFGDGLDPEVRQAVLAAREKTVGDLEEDAHAVAGLALGVFTSPMLQFLHDLQCVIHGLVRFTTLNIHHRANAAGIVLKGGVVQPLPLISLCSRLYHSYCPFPGGFRRILSPGDGYSTAQMRSTASRVASASPKAVSRM